MNWTYSEIEAQWQSALTYTVIHFAEVAGSAGWTDYFLHELAQSLGIA